VGRRRRRRRRGARVEEKAREEGTRWWRMASQSRQLRLN